MVAPGHGGLTGIHEALLAAVQSSDMSVPATKNRKLYSAHSVNLCVDLRKLIYAQSALVSIYLTNTNPKLSLRKYHIERI